jgi:hypothetical protein
MWHWAHDGQATLGAGNRLARFELRVIRDEKERIYIAEDSLKGLAQVRSENQQGRSRLRPSMQASQDCPNTLPRPKRIPLTPPPGAKAK